MPSTFYALPLSQHGESFLLQTGLGEERSILADVGRELDPKHHSTLAAVIGSHASATRNIDRLILTHEDTDHCGGAAQFIKEWCGRGRSISEAWLPALWLPGAGTGARDGWNISRIVEGALEAAPEIADMIRRIGNEADDQRGDREPQEQLTEPFRDMDGDAADWGRSSAMLDVIFREAAGGDARGQVPELPSPYANGEGSDRHIFSCPHRDPSTGVCVICAMETIDDGQLERRIAGLALQLAEIAIQTHTNIAPAIAACQANSIPVRWFDYLLYASTLSARGGDRGFLTPVNARELVPTGRPVTARAMFFALFLTRANRESLVYLRHEATDEPAVLFTADSRLKVGRRPMPVPAGVPTRTRLLATAPHHASKSNSAAYGVLKGWLPDYPPVFVQNGGHGVKEAAADFKAVPDHLCVRCVKSAAPPQLVKLHAPGGSWDVPARPTACTCP